MRSLLLLAVLAASALAARAAVPAGELESVRQLLRDKKLTEAQAAAARLVAAFPREAEAHSLLGSVAMSRQTPEPAVKAFERAVELAPASSDLHRRLGDAYGFSAQKAGMLSKFGLARKCLAAYEKSVALDPKNVSARLSLLGYYQQAPGMVGGGMDKAYAQADEIRKLDPRRGLVALAGLHVAEKKFTEAFQLFEDALKETPADYAALFQFGRAAAMSGEKLDRGAETLRQCLALTPPPGQPGHEAANWRLGMILEKKGDKTAARTHYEAALKINPEFAQASESLKKLE